MNHTFFLFLILFCFACNSETKKDKPIPISKSEPIEKPIQEVGNIVLNFDDSDKKAILINHKKYVELSNSNTFKGLIDENENIIIPIENYYHHKEVLDINNDGFQDIRVYIFSNTPNECKNYLFDKESQTFKLLENCDLDIEQISGTNLYYAYHSIGCADMNWESYLSRIVDFKLETVGEIVAKNCNEKDDGFKIYKSTNLQKTLLETLPNANFDIEGKNNKFDFLKYYWKTHYRMFE
jgi:hypothetical protein